MAIDFLDNFELLLGLIVQWLAGGAMAGFRRAALHCDWRIRFFIFCTGGGAGRHVTVTSQGLSLTYFLSKGFVAKQKRVATEILGKTPEPAP